MTVSQGPAKRRLSQIGKKSHDEDTISDKIEIDSDNIETPPATRRVFSPPKEVKPVEKEPCKRERCSNSIQGREATKPGNSYGDLGSGNFDRFSAARRTRRYKKNQDPEKQEVPVKHETTLKLDSTVDKLNSSLKTENFKIDNSMKFNGNKGENYLGNVDLKIEEPLMEKSGSKIEGPLKKEEPMKIETPLKLGLLKQEEIKPSVLKLENSNDAPRRPSSLSISKDAIDNDAMLHVWQEKLKRRNVTNDIDAALAEIAKAEEDLQQLSKSAAQRSSRLPVTQPAPVIAVTNTVLSPVMQESRPREAPFILTERAIQSRERRRSMIDPSQVIRIFISHFSLFPIFLFHHLLAFILSVMFIFLGQ